MPKWGVAFAGLRHDHIYALHALASQKAELEVLGCWEEDPASIQRAREKNVRIGYATFDELLRDDIVDVVAIGSYYGARGEMVIRALEAGKHVIADKPLCTEEKELERIRALAKQKGLSVGLMLDLADHANVLRAMELIKKGALGRINNIHFNGQHPLLFGVRPAWYFEKGKHGGVINDIAVHGIDLVRTITGADVARVIGARCWNFYAKAHPDFCDSAQLVLQMSDGCGVIADVSYASPDSYGYTLPSYWSFEIAGERGMLSFSFSSDGVRAYLNGDTVARVYPPVAPVSDYLDAFLQDIGTCGAYTDRMLAVTEQTLFIQRAAR
jgi:predicted dehydrogenase